MGGAFWNLFFFVIAIGLLVTVHELGHFLAARRCGVKVLRFSVGFGPVLWSHKGHDGTEYAVSAIPLGGYVKMKGEAENALQSDDGSESETKVIESDFAELRTGSYSEESDKDSFAAQSCLKRAVIIGAGPAFNIVLAFVLYAVINLTGVTSVRPVAGEVLADSPAHSAGLQSGDEFLEADGVKTESWPDFVSAVIKGSGEKINFTVERASDQTEHTVTFDFSSLSITPDTGVFELLGFRPYTGKVSLRLTQVTEGGPAYRAGIRKGDMIVGVDNTLTAGWYATQQKIAAHKDLTSPVMISAVRFGVPAELSDEDRVNISMLKDALQNAGSREALLMLKELNTHSSSVRVLSFEVMPETRVASSGKETVIIGVGTEITPDPTLIREVKYGALESLSKALKDTAETGSFILVSVKKMLTGEISARNIGGPVAIAKSAGSTASQGVSAFLWFLAAISVNLGIVNLLPVPVLDGGQLLFIAYEAVCKRKPSEKVQNVLTYMGIFVLMSVMALALFNDLTLL